MNLLEILSEEVTDPRRLQGMRTTMAQMFKIIIISNLCGHFGGRAVAKFSKNYAKTFTELLNLKHPPPSHVTFSDLLNRTDEKQLIKAFNRWAKDYVDLEDNAFVSGDGKALGSTVTNAHGSRQNFQAVVSLFCQKSGLVHSLETYKNAKESEINVVRFLVKQLKAKGLVLFF
jgi:hypothetical protein